MKHKYLFLLFFPLISMLAHAQQMDSPIFALDTALLKNSNAVVKLHRMEVSLDNPKEMTIQSKRTVTVLNKKGQLAVDTYVYYDNNRRILNLEAVAHDAWGNEIKKFSKRDFMDKSAVPNGTLYSDSRFKYLDFEPAAYPYTITMTYRIKTDNTASLPVFYFIKNFNTAVEKSEFILKYDKNELNINFKEKNFGRYHIEKKESPSGVTYTATHLKAIGHEALGPSLDRSVPKLLVSPSTFYISGNQGDASNWKEFGSWMYNDILKGRTELSKETISKMKKLTESLKTPREKAERIYRYVQNNTRYISVQVGIGGIQPAPALEVDRLKYGDCKGLTNYTRALLKCVGVPSYYTHVEAGRGSKVDFETDFASLAQGNHVILAIPCPKGLFWVDCTSNSDPFGYLGSFTDDRQVLMITPEGGKIAHTPSYLDKSNFKKTTGAITLDKNGAMTGKITIGTGGVRYGNYAGLSSLSPEDLKKYYKNRWDNLHQLKIVDFHFKNDKNKLDFIEQISLSSTNFATRAGTYLLFEPSALNKDDYVPPSYPNRKSPFNISRGFLDQDSISILIPKGYKIESLPITANIQNEFGIYKRKLTQTNDTTLVYTKHLLIKSGEYSKEKYAAYRDFRKKIAEYENQKASLTKTN